MNRRLYLPLIPAVLLLASCEDETGLTRPSTPVATSISENVVDGRVAVEVDPIVRLLSNGNVEVSVRAACPEGYVREESGLLRLEQGFASGEGDVALPVGGCSGRLQSANAVVFTFDTPFRLGSARVSFTFAVVNPNDETDQLQAGVNQTVEIQAAASNTWTRKADMPTPRSFLAGGVANNSLGQPVFYAMGGIDPNTGPVRTVEAYNFATDRWTTRAGLPVVLSSTNGVVNIGGKLYLSGGFFSAPDGRSGTSRALYVYDPGRNTWTRKADMPRKIAQGISGEINGKLYVLTGSCQYCPNRISRYLYRYDPVTNTWSTDFPWSPNAHVSGAGAVINGKFYVAGGRGNDGRETNKLDVYDPVTNRWTTLAPMPTARSGAAAARLQNKLYVIGNASVDPGEPQGQVEAYDPVTNRWTKKASLGGAGRGDLAAGRVTWQGLSYILAVGGTDVEGSGSGSVNQAYTP
jgi:N-acetylneuraminic acid mutarotase